MEASCALGLLFVDHGGVGMSSGGGDCEVVVSAVGRKAFVLIKVFPVSFFHSSHVLIKSITIQIDKITPIGIREDLILKLIFENRHSLSRLPSSQNLVIVQRP